MERLICKDCSELAEYMIDRAQDGVYVVAALFYNEAKALLRELMLFTDIDFDSIDIEPEFYGAYDKEYYISLSDDMICCVEKAYKGGIYLEADADLTLIDNEASCRIISDLEGNKCRELYIGTQPEEFDTEINENVNANAMTDMIFENLFKGLKIIRDEAGSFIGFSLGY